MNLKNKKYSNIYFFVFSTILLLIFSLVFLDKSFQKQILKIMFFVFLKKVLGKEKEVIVKPL